MNQNRRKGKTTLIILSLICIALIGISIAGSRAISPLTGFTGMIITPIQKGMNQVGAFLSGFSDNMTDAASLREENAQLQTQVDDALQQLQTVDDALQQLQTQADDALQQARAMLPQRVADLGIQYMRGVQSQGVMAVAKKSCDITPRPWR